MFRLLLVFMIRSSCFMWAAGCRLKCGPLAPVCQCTPQDITLYYMEKQVTSQPISQSFPENHPKQTKKPTGLPVGFFILKWSRRDTKTAQRAISLGQRPNFTRCKRISLSQRLNFTGMLFQQHPLSPRSGSHAARDGRPRTRCSGRSPRCARPRWGRSCLRPWPACWRRCGGGSSQRTSRRCTGRSGCP